ncbi:MAG: P-loop ATPase, Sll1717 family [Desulfurivibrionaceae bacterium]
MSSLINKQFTLKDISKGSTSGEDEADFLEGFENYFYDYENNSEKVMAPNIFYLIGRKGSGKSILAKYVEKIFSDREIYFNQFVTVSSFRNFKYQTLQDYRDKDFSEKEYFFIWKWCLLINIAYQLIDDQSCKDNESLLGLGIFLKENFGIKINQKKVFDRSKNIKWTLGASKLAQVSGGVDSDIETGSYLDYLQNLEEIVISIGQSTLSKFSIFYHCCLINL